MGNQLKCVIAGYGYMGEIRKRVIQNTPDLQLVGVYDTDPTKTDRSMTAILILLLKNYLILNRISYLSAFRTYMPQNYALKVCKWVNTFFVKNLRVETSMTSNA